MDTQQVYINVQEMSKWDGPDENIYMNEGPEDTCEAEAPPPVASEGPPPPSPHRGACLCGAAAAMALLAALLSAALILLGFTWVTLNTRTKDMRASISSLTDERGLLQSSNVIMEAFNRNLSGRVMQMETETLQLQDRLTALSTERDQSRAERDQSRAERDQSRAERDQSRAERDQSRAERDQSRAERDRLRRTIDAIHCRDPWVRFHNSCYLLSPNPKSWTDSRQDCEEQGAHLVVITSPEEQRFVSSLTAQRVWIGLTDRDTEDEWRWVTGDNVTSPTYWRAGQPDNWKGEEDCGESGNHQWNDLKCSVKQRFICERLSQNVCNCRN